MNIKECVDDKTVKLDIVPVKFELILWEAGWTGEKRGEGKGRKISGGEGKAGRGVERKRRGWTLPIRVKIRAWEVHIISNYSS